MKIALALAVLLIVTIGYFEKPDITPTAPSSTPALKEHPVAITKDQAVSIIFELPEIKAWSSYIERTTEGKVHGLIMTPSEESVTIGGKQYWSVDFYESQPTHINRWESFLVSHLGKEILVDDIMDGAITLQEWRNSKKPMERIQKTNTP
jgi:hypothetical protein